MVLETQAGGGSPSQWPASSAASAASSSFISVRASTKGNSDHTSAAGGLLALLEVEGHLCVGTSFVDPAKVQEGDGPHETPVRQSDQPILGAGRLDQPVAQPTGGVQLTVGDQQELRRRAHQ